MTPPIPHLPAGTQMTDRTIQIGGRQVDVHIPGNDSVELQDNLYHTPVDPDTGNDLREVGYGRHQVFLNGQWTSVYMTDSDYDAYAAGFLAGPIDCVSLPSSAGSAGGLFPPDAHAGTQQSHLPFRPLSGDVFGQVGYHYIRLDTDPDASGQFHHISGIGSSDPAQIAVLRNHGYVEVVGQQTNNRGETLTVFASPLEAHYARMPK